VQAALAPLHDMRSALAVTAERAVSRILGGSCQVPLASFAQSGLSRLAESVTEGIETVRAFRSDPDVEAAGLSGVVASVIDNVLSLASLPRLFASVSELAAMPISPDALAPIQTRNLDLGLRYVSTDRAFSIQAYDVDLKNGVGIVPRDPTAILDPDEIVRGNVATRAANTLGQTSRGLEVTGFQNLGVIDLYAAFAYQDATHDNPAAGSADRATLASLGIIGGARVRDIPRHSLFAQVGWSPTRNVRVELNARYVGERAGGHIIAPTTFREVEVETLEAYTIMGLTAHYDLDVAGLPTTRLQFNIDNLFDETYLAAVSSSTANQPEFGLTSGPNVRTLDRYFVGAPRTLTVSLRTRF
jgi:outer membrane receptor protein involved in Fe transport